MKAWRKHIRLVRRGVKVGEVARRFMQTREWAREFVRRCGMH